MQALKQTDIGNIVFLDIETVASVEKLEKDTPLYDSWEYKQKFSRDKTNEPIPLEESYLRDAALYPEFAKIVCITIGKIIDGKLKRKSYASSDEVALLTDFSKGLTNIVADNKKTVLCGHAIKGFDIPFIMRRCLINQVPLAPLIDVGHLKPWEQSSLDTLELWKAGGFNSASLINIAVAMGIPNPKDDLAGYQTTDYYYNNPNGLELIVTYCEKDVLTVANIVRRCRYEPLLEPAIGTVEVAKVGLLQSINATKELTKEQEKEVIGKLGKLDSEEEPIAQEILSTIMPPKKLNKAVKKKVNDATP